MRTPSGQLGSQQGPVVHIESVTKLYGATAAINDVTLEIGNEFFSLLGPSGSGKTTLLRIIGGFVGISQGRVSIAGVDVANTPPYRRPCNTVFQHYALFPHLSVADNVAFGLKESKVGKDERRARVGEALDMVRMSSTASRRPHELSGGQQQRIALARALVNRPAVLLLDEPLAALDAQLRKNMQLELKRLQQEVGITFIYVTHDQEEALVMSDRIAVLNDGKVRQVGSPRSVYDCPQSEFVARFIGQSNVLPGVVILTSDRVESRVKTASGRIVPAMGGAPPGSHGSLMIRPEDVLLSSTVPVDMDQGVLQGRVEQKTYLGSSLRVEVAIDGVTMVGSLGKEHADHLDVGTEVWVSWTPSSARFLPDENGA